MIVSAAGVLSRLRLALIAQPWVAIAACGFVMSARHNRQIAARANRKEHTPCHHWLNLPIA